MPPSPRHNDPVRLPLGALLLWGLAVVFRATPTGEPHPRNARVPVVIADTVAVVLAVTSPHTALEPGDVVSLSRTMAVFRNETRIRPDDPYPQPALPQ